MKSLCFAFVLAGVLIGAPPLAMAQSNPAALPALTADQSANVEREMQLYRREVDDRVARREITPDEAQRLLGWREWQLAQQAAGLASPPRVAQRPPDAAPMSVDRLYDYYPYTYYPYRPYPYYVAPGPYYWAPWPYWGLSVCAGGWGHRWGGRVCF